jgi:hypothetical protein
MIRKYATVLVVCVLLLGLSALAAFADSGVGASVSKQAMVDDENGLKLAKVAQDLAALAWPMKAYDDDDMAAQLYHRAECAYKLALEASKNGNNPSVLVRLSQELITACKEVLSARR